MTNYSVNSIVNKIKKAFPCEAISEPICAEVKRAISSGVMPKFNDVECTCIKDKKSKKCNVSTKFIETKLYALGVVEMCQAMVKPELVEEGEYE